MCGNLEFFNQRAETPAASAAPGLSERIFGLRVNLIDELDRAAMPDDSLVSLRAAMATLLREQVAAMPPENFLVRAKRRLVEKYSDPGAWEQLDVVAQGELTREVAGSAYDCGGR